MNCIHREKITKIALFAPHSHVTVCVEWGSCFPHSCLCTGPAESSESKRCVWSSLAREVVRGEHHSAFSICGFHFQDFDYWFAIIIIFFFYAYCGKSQTTKEQKKKKKNEKSLQILPTSYFSLSIHFNCYKKLNFAKRFSAPNNWTSGKDMCVFFFCASERVYMGSLHSWYNNFKTINCTVAV